MSSVIYKYDLPPAATQVLPMPKGARIISIQVQRGIPRIWAVVDANVPLEDRTFLTLGTGHTHESIPENYIGSYQLEGGSFVGHVFEVT